MLQSTKTSNLTLAEGRHITTDDTHVAIISQDLAERNELKIGDYLTAHSYSVEDQGFTGPEIRVQIIGLFTPHAVEQFGETVTTYDKIQNRVFVDLQSSKEFDGGEINYGFSALHVTIDDPQDMARVVAEVKALPGIDWKAFTVEVDNETYENAAAPLATLNELVVTLLVVIIVVSAIILALILTLWTKTRIHEIGVFLSVGIRKSAIIGQYLIEVLLIAVLAFGLSYFTSNAIAGQIGNHLLEQSMQTGWSGGVFVSFIVHFHSEGFPVDLRQGLDIGHHPRHTAHSYSVEDQGFTGQEIKVQIIGLFSPNAVEQFGDLILRIGRDCSGEQGKSVKRQKIVLSCAAIFYAGNAFNGLMIPMWRSSARTWRSGTS